MLRARDIFTVLAQVPEVNGEMPGTLPRSFQPESAHEVAAMSSVSQRHGTCCKQHPVTCPLLREPCGTPRRACRQGQAPSCDDVDAFAALTRPRHCNDRLTMITGGLPRRAPRLPGLDDHRAAIPASLPHPRFIAATLRSEVTLYPSPPEHRMAP